MSFTARLADTQRRTGGVLCVGLDPDPDHLPPPFRRRDGVVDFCRAIVDATVEYACAFKINFAFFEALGDDGTRALRAVRRHVPASVPVIADAKRGDIGNSARFYARSIFDDLGFDAVTVSPYMGRDSVEPFLAYDGTATFILARTSNPGAADFQHRSADGVPLYLAVAKAAHAWNAESPGTAGLVAGATDAGALAELRSAARGLPLLVPGVGAQGGDPAAVLRGGWDGPGTLLVNSSRAILYASAGADFAEAAQRSARTAAHSLTLPGT